MSRRVVFLAQGLFVLMFVALAVSNFQLRREISSGRKPVTHPRFRAGESLPRFEARDAANTTVALGGVAQQGTVVVLFAPGCGACDAVLDQVAASPRPNVAAVSLVPRQRTEAESRKIAGKVPVYFVDRIQHSPIGSRSHVVPQILRIGAGGRIDEVCKSYQACTQASKS
jgi:hypothetical protein